MTIGACGENTAKGTNKKKKKETNGSERCEETDKGRENWWLRWVKMPKYPLKRQ